MNTQQIKEEIANLPLLEQIALVADIWDSISANNQPIPLPQWQMTELDRRYKEFSDGEQNLHDWQHVHEELRNKYKA